MPDDVLPEPDERALRTGMRLLRLLSYYHRHRILGLHHVPRNGACLLATTHSFASYDAALLAFRIHRATGRLVRGLADRALFMGPFESISTSVGFVEASPNNGAALLEQGELVLVAPGGMREALRPSHERYQVRWHRRKGFARLAIASGAPIVLAACPDADRLYRVYESDLTKWVYQTARLPLPMVRGWGPTLLPRPVALTHVLSEPMHPPAASPDDEVAVDAWHAELVQRVTELVEEARALAPEPGGS